MFDGKFHLRVSGSSGPGYTLLTSTTLTHWTSLGATNPASVPFLFTDTDAASFPPRFYRVLLGP